MVKTFMLLLAFTITDPNGVERDEIINVLSRHFDTNSECVVFVESWESTIRSRGVGAVRDMLKDGYNVDLVHVGCTEKPNLEVLKGVEEPFLDKFEDEVNEESDK